MKYSNIEEARMHCLRIVQYPNDKDLFLVLHCWSKYSFASHMWNAQDGGLYHGGYYVREDDVGETDIQLEQRALNAFNRRVAKLYAGFLTEGEK